MSGGDDRRLSAPTLDELLAIAGGFAAKHLIDTKNSLSPTWLVPTPAELKIIVTAWSSDFERQVMLAEMRKLLRETEASVYLVFSEVWLVRHEGPEYPADAPPPRLDPKREEKVGAYAVARSGERRGRLWGITRDYKGTVRLLTPEDDPGPDVTGALVTMFDEPR